MHEPGLQPNNVDHSEHYDNQPPPPVPIKTYQWEDIRRARQQGGYPWTHWDKPAFDAVIIDAETILKEEAPPIFAEGDMANQDRIPQKILMLDSSPGSSRRVTETEDSDNQIRIPNFSKEISLDSEEDALEKAAAGIDIPVAKLDTKVSLSPKGILKRQHFDKGKERPLSQDSNAGNTKCCHPIVEKIKHIADKTIHKGDKPQSPKPIRTIKKFPLMDRQEIVQLENSPGTERRERLQAAAAAKNKQIGIDNDRVFDIPKEFLPEPSPPSRKRKEHIYEDIEKQKSMEGMNGNVPTDDKDADTKSAYSDKDPSLIIDDVSDEDEKTASVEEVVAKVKSMFDTKMSIDDIVQHVDKEKEVVIIEEIIDDEVETPVEEKKPSADGESEQWSKLSDHDYEPIGKPDSESPYPASEPEREEVKDVQRKSGTPTFEVSPPEHATENAEAALRPTKEIPITDDDVSSTTSRERQYLRLPDEYDSAGDNEAFSATDDGDTTHLDSLKKQVEDLRYVVYTPTTTASRTDCEMSTSQIDSSALEDLPLERESRRKPTGGLDTSKLQQRIKNQTGKLKSQAGKLRTKLKTVKRPQFHLPERPKFERPKFNLPERPKINFPDRTKFKMPERPKINFPDRSKFTLPDRPKFNLPNRPKFSLPDKSKFKLPDKAKINFPSFSRSRDASADSANTSKKPMLNFDFKTYPRIFNRSKKDKKAPSERPDTPPPGFSTFPKVKHDRQQVVAASHWNDSSGRSTEDEPRNYGMSQTSYEMDNDFQSKLAKVDKDYHQMQQDYEKENMEIQKNVKSKQENADIWNAMDRNNAQKSDHRNSLPFIVPTGHDLDKYENSIQNDDDESSAASAGHPRRGVLEEIDKDEFFLRQKGISQDNIEVGKYLSNEIRDAFRSPVNALNQLDHNNISTNINTVDPDIEYYDEDESKDKEAMIENDDGYYTFPPVRPSRARKMKVKAANEIEEYQNELVTEVTGKYITDLPRSEIAPESVPTMFMEDNSADINKRNIFVYKEADILDDINEYENEIEQIKELTLITIPSAPKRKKKNTRDFDDVNVSENGIDYPDDEEENWMKNIEKIPQMQEEVMVHREEYVIITKNVDQENEEGPTAPRRSRPQSRTTSRATSRATSLGDDDRTSRGAESLTLDSHMHLASEENLDIEDMETPGYATVDKTIQQKSEPPPRPPAPVRRQKSTKSTNGDRQFFTVPRAIKESSPPKRPLRNYSTLGPSRPPRKKSTTSLTDINDHNASEQYDEIENDDTESEIHKNLQSGDVISKMKDRPLPPPPRPPRGSRKKTSSDDKKDMDDDPVLIEDAIIDESRFQSDEIKQRLQPSNSYDQEEIIEIEVSTQTDPLPDDFDFELGLECDNQEYLQNEPEENSIDQEILSKGLQKFRESSRPNSRTGKSRSSVERTKTPIDRPKTPLGRISPTAILVERRVSSPTRIHDRRELLTEATLTVIPIDEPVSCESASHSLSSQNRKTPELKHPKPVKSTWQDNKDLDLENEQAVTILQRPTPEELHMHTRRFDLPEGFSTAIVNRDNKEVEMLKTQRLQVSDLEVERLNVGELQASKILVSEIEGLSLQVTDLNSQSGHIVVRGIELGPGVMEEIMQKISQMPSTSTSTPSVQTQPGVNEETQTELASYAEDKVEVQQAETQNSEPPERPPPPQMPPVAFGAYYPEYSVPPASFYRMRPPGEYMDPELPPNRRRRQHRKEPSSSSDEHRPTSRRPPQRAAEPSVSELSVQLFRACQSSIHRTVRYMLAYITSHFNGEGDKKDVQMAVVVFLIMVAGLIVLGVGDGKTIHHHHWDFFNPPTSE